MGHANRIYLATLWAMTPEQERRDCERTFRRYGLPLLVHEHSSRRDVFGRAAPLLVVVLLFEVIAVAQFTWPWWLNTLVIIGVMTGLGLGYAGLNVLRGRPWATLPQDVGKVELTFFVLAPGLLVSLSGGQWRAGLSIAVGNLLLLGTIQLVVRYGLGSTLWWGATRIGNELGGSLLRLVRFLPLLLIFSMALFFSNEIWQLFDHTPGTSDVILGAFFVALILLILRIRLRTETAQVLRQAKAQTSGAEHLPPLTRPQLLNVAVMVGSNQLLQVIVVSVGVGLFFFALGVLTVTGVLHSVWGVSGGELWYTIDLRDGNLIITQTHLRVAVAMATFTGLYYAISVFTDAVYREDFISEMTTKMVHVTEHRVRYAALIDTTGVAAAATGPSGAERAGADRTDIADEPAIVMPSAGLASDTSGSGEHER